MISDTSETFVTRLVPFAVLFSRKVPLSERKVSKETFGMSRLLLRLRSKTSRLLKILLPFSFQGRYLQQRIANRFPSLPRTSLLHSSLLPMTCETLCVSLVGPSGLEPPTSCLSGTRSNLLSYEPMQFVVSLPWFSSFGLPSSEEPDTRSRFPGFPGLVEMMRFELMTPCLQGRCSPN